ncbi:MAG TPA: response regulator [Kofleriaceae bacterium]
MKRVLFVDDEPAILARLEDTLRKGRARWDMTFVVGAEAALARMRAHPFDVIVSDLHMPGMDGAALLERVKAEFPSTVRVIVSGHADRDAIARALPAMHQFLSKPCDPMRLRDAIERSTPRIASHVLAAIGGLDKVPAPPRSFQELSALAQDPEAPLTAIAAVVTRDPALAAKVLQLANSAAFGVGRPLTSIGESVRYLGCELLKSLALATSIFAPAPHVAQAGFSLDDMQDTALRAATFARGIAPRADAEVVFTATLLRDIGELVLAFVRTATYAQLRRDAAALGESRLAAERRILGATHAEIGACLLGMWGLPSPIVELVAMHHSPQHAAPALHRPLALLHVADVLAGETGAGLDVPFLEVAGVAPRIDVWRSLAPAR